MKINAISLWSVDLTSHETYYMADGKTCDTVTSHVVCISTDTGLTGWGEVCPIPHYLPAFAGGVPSVVTAKTDRELSGIRMAATSGLSRPVAAKKSPTTLYRTDTQSAAAMTLRP